MHSTLTGRPFWGGTYLPRAQFLELLDAIEDAWHAKRDELATNADSIIGAISRAISPRDDVPSLDLVNDTLQQIAGAFDQEWGGFGQAPKFPSHASPATGVAGAT